MKAYDDMNRQEKRAYKRWLAKNHLWDGAEVIERLSKEKRLNTDLQEHEKNPD